VRESRNPFKIRATEYIESDETFVRLFSPNVLEILSNKDIWNKPLIIRSAPGGGKSSLLRLFTPRALLTVYKLRTREHTKDLYDRLHQLEAINENGPLVLGIYLSCSNSYAALEDLDIDNIKKQRLLLSLINARIVLSALHGTLSLKGILILPSPDFLYRVTAANYMNGPVLLRKTFAMQWTVLTRSSTPI
jgi:hypothetical protein